MQIVQRSKVHLYISLTHQRLQYDHAIPCVMWKLVEEKDCSQKTYCLTMMMMCPQVHRTISLGEEMIEMTLVWICNYDPRAAAMKKKQLQKKEEDQQREGSS